jgi:hypothetical protein
MELSDGDGMSAFDEMLKKLDSMVGEDREAEINSLRAECICPDCPSYNKCAEEASELLFCFLGRGGECIKMELGCNCPDCPVAARTGLVNLYYCIYGSESERHN